MILGAGTQTFLGVILGFTFWGSKDLPGRRIALTLIFTPMIMAPLATGSFFKLIYDPVFGILNYFIKGVFGVTIDFLGSSAWAFPAVLIVDTWMWTPFMMMMTLAALGSVPKAELEAAEVENLSWYQRLVHVVLPHGKFILMLGILLRTIDSFKSMDIIFTMTRGGPGNATELIGITLYRQAFNAFTMGQASALAIISLLIAISFTSIYLHVLKKKGGGGVNVTPKSSERFKKSPLSFDFVGDFHPFFLADRLDDHLLLQDQGTDHHHSPEMAVCAFIAKLHRLV